MSRILWRSSLRYGLHHPWLVALSILGIAIGVAVVVSIDIANESARRAFGLSAETITGRATHQIIGGPAGLPENFYRTLRVEENIRPAAPVVEGFVLVEDAAGRTLHLLGIDLFAEGPFRPYLDDERRGRIDLPRFMTLPRTGALAHATAQELELAEGDSFAVRIDGRQHFITLAGQLEAEDPSSARALEGLLVTDIASAQELLGMTGRLSRIDLIVPEDDPGLLQRIASLLPPGAEVMRAAARSETLDQMTRAFSLNLTALSLLALIVGMFLIYNTMTFSVVQRRELIGTQRALGVTRREIFTLVLFEAFVIGIAGTALGLLIGILLSYELVRLVTQTINDLYFVVTVRETTIAPLTLLKGIGLGLGATLLAALSPAREATMAPPTVTMRRSAVESRLRRMVPRLAATGLALGLAGAALLMLPSRSLALSYTALLMIILGFALAAPAATLVLAQLFRPVLGALFGILGRMSARGIVSTLSRTSMAVASLMIAVAATVGIGIMVDSFRQTVVQWLDMTLQADVYVSPPSLVSRRIEATLPPEIVLRLAAAPGVAAVNTLRSVEVESGQGLTEVIALRLSERSYETFRFKEGNPAVVWPAFQEGDAVIISEPYGYRHGLRAGDHVRLRTDRGEHSFPITGVFYDYGSDLGIVMMSRRTYDRFYDDEAISSISLFAEPGTDVDALISSLRQMAGAEQELLIRSNRALREASLEVFDRTFTITDVLRLLAVLAAFIGVLSALMALQLERERELAVLRATGLTPRQVYGLVSLQTGLMGFVAGLLSLPVGIVLASVLVYVINRRSFGWTLQLEIAPEILLQAVVLALVSALLAGLYPSWKMSKASPARALREE